MLTKKPWSFHSKKLDENEKSLETYENHPGEVRCGIVSMNQGFVDSKWKMYSLTYFYPYPCGLPNVESFIRHLSVNIRLNTELLRFISSNQWRSSGIDKKILVSMAR